MDTTNLMLLQMLQKMDEQCQANQKEMQELCRTNKEERRADIFQELRLRWNPTVTHTFIDRLPTMKIGFTKLSGEPED